MPINIKTYIKTSPTDTSLGVLQPPAPEREPVVPILSTQRDYRFAGYHLLRDGDGNIILQLPVGAWLNQPQSWSREQMNEGTFDLRAP